MERWMVKKWIAMHEWPLFWIESKVLWKKLKHTKLGKKTTAQTSKSSLLSHPFTKTPQNLCIPLVIVPNRFVLSGSVPFHCFASFNVCFNFFIEWTILKFSAWFRPRFFDNFLRTFFVSYFHYRNFSWMFAIFSHLETIVVEKEKKEKKNENTQAHARTHVKKCAHRWPFHFNDHKSFSYHSHCYGYTYIAFTWCRLTLQTSFSCRAYPNVYACTECAHVHVHSLSLFGHFLFT